MIAILNRDGTNRAVAEVNLDLVFEDEEPDTSIYSAEGVQNLICSEYVADGFFDEQVQRTPEDISLQLKALFEETLSD